MSGFLTGPELSRDAVSGGLLALGVVVAAHAPSRLNNETTARLTMVPLISLFFIYEVILREGIPAIARLGDFSVPLAR
ncbi:MAG: hypothetical protein QOJ58_5048 [Alphaproteobacteria bacterium]|jgi:hypothetical protein|nr:hypothetical protein [Alphaproteobacteria bacterium]